MLKQYAAQLNGVIKLIFQPAEEGTRGARAMVAAGVVDDVDYFTAIHIGTGVPAGTVVCGGDNFMATTKFDVQFSGVAAHAGGKPEDGRNALLAAAQAALGLHAIPPHSAGASRVNVGVMQAGTGRNVVPSSALLKVETRGESEAINQYVFERAQHVVAGAAAMYRSPLRTAHDGRGDRQRTVAGVGGLSARTGRPGARRATGGGSHRRPGGLGRRHPDDGPGPGARRPRLVHDFRH